jgi:hypothetical protein
MMKRVVLSVQQRPYLLFPLIALVLIIYSFFTGHETTDIHVDDTMFILSGPSVYWLISFYFLVTAALYFVLQRFLRSRALTWVHVLLTLLVLLSAAVSIHRSNALNQQTNVRQVVHYIQASESVYHWLILLFVVAQLIFVSHLVWGIVRYFIKKQ